MTLEKNVERMFWRLKNGKFTPNENDVKAMVEIVEWINRQKEASINEHQLFAKLYCHVFLQEIEFYKDIPTAQRSTHEILMKSLTEHYHAFHKGLNDFELLRFQKSLGVSDKHPVFRSEQENESDKAILSKNQDAYLKHVQGLWDYSKVETALNNQITEALNKYRNLQ